MDSSTCCNQHPDLEFATDVLPRGVSLGYELSDFTKGKKNSSIEQLLRQLFKLSVFFLQL